MTELATTLCDALSDNEIGDKRLLNGSIGLDTNSSTSMSAIFICTYVQKISSTVVLISGTRVLGGNSCCLYQEEFYLSSDGSNTTLSSSYAYLYPHLML